MNEQKESLVEAILRMGFWMDPTERWWFLWSVHRRVL